MNRAVQGRHIVRMVRLLAAIGLLMVITTVGLIGWTLSQVRSQRKAAGIAQEVLDKTTKELRESAALGGAQLYGVLDLSATGKDAREAVARLVRSLDGQDPALSARLSRTTERVAGWRAAYDLVWQDAGPQRTLSQVRAQLAGLRVAMEMTEGRRRLDDALQFQRWRRGGAQGALAVTMVLAHARQESREAGEFKNQLGEGSQLVELLNGEEDLDHLADIRDNRLKPVLARLEHLVTTVDPAAGAAQAQAPTQAQAQTPTQTPTQAPTPGAALTPGAVEALKLAIIGRPVGSPEGGLGGPGGLFALRSHLLRLRRDRDRLKGELRGLFLDLEAANAALGRTAQVSSHLLTERVEGGLTAAWRRLLVFSCASVALFLWLTLRISSGIDGQVSAIEARNRDMRLVLDNVNQGLLTLNVDGTVGGERSAVVQRWLGALPAGQTFWQALQPLAPEVADAFHFAWESIVEDVMPLELTLEQMPHRLDIKELSLRLDYVPIFSKEGRGPAAPDEDQNGGKLHKLLLVVSDITSQIAQARAEAEQREILTVFQKIVANKTVFLEFFNDASALVTAVCGGQELDLVTLKRQVHTLKGNCGVYGLGGIAAICHAAEERMKETGAGMSLHDRELLGAAWAAFSLKLAKLVEQDGPILIEIEKHEHERVVQALASGLPRQEILDTIAAWRSQPVKGRLFAFAEQIKELGKRLDKGEITVEVDAEGLRLPAERFAGFWGAFTHVVRNAVDHGLETAEEREGAGKDDQPKIVLAARVDEKKQQVVIEVRDNGKGVDWERLGKKAAERGLPHTTREDLVAALFADGVSTRDVATEMSGRGVGMAAVREEVDSLGGHIKVDSEPGVGTTFQFRFPRLLLLAGLRAQPSLRPGPVRGPRSL